MNIFRYTDKVQKYFGLKTKPEPWLHAAVEVSQEGLHIAVYVWDTRKVVESRATPFKDQMQYRATAKAIMSSAKRWAKANDNREKLQWNGKPISAIDASMK